MGSNVEMEDIFIYFIKLFALFCFLFCMCDPVLPVKPEIIYCIINNKTTTLSFVCLFLLSNI
jgi:hypothetical protein